MFFSKAHICYFISKCWKICPLVLLAIGKLLFLSFKNVKCGQLLTNSKLSWNPELSRNMEMKDQKTSPPTVPLQFLAGKGGYGVTFLLLVMYSKLQMAYCQLRLAKAAQPQATANFSCAAIAFVLKKTSSLDFQKLSRVISLSCTCSFVSPSLAPSTTLHLFPIHQSSSPSFLSLSFLCLSFSLSLRSDHTKDVILSRLTTRIAV